MLLEELQGFLDKVIQRKRVKAILLFQFHGLQFLASKCISDKTQFEIQIVRILGSELPASCLVVQMNNLFNCISNKVVVLWLVTNYHVSFIELNCISWGTLWCSLAFTSSCSIYLSGQNLLNIGFVLGHQLAWPLTLVVQVVHQLQIFDVGAGCGRDSILCVVLHSVLGLLLGGLITDDLCPFDEELLPFVPVSWVCLI